MSAEPDSHKIDVGLLITALAGISTSLGLALALGGAALALVLADASSAALGAFWWAAGFVVVGACGLPLAFWTGRSILRLPPAAPSRPAATWAWIALAFPPAIALGYLAFSRGWLPQIIGPAAQILAAGIPVAVIVLVARRQGPPLSPRRAWGQFVLGLWATPAVALFAETLLLVPAAGVVATGLLITSQGSDLIQGILETRKLSLETALQPDVLRAHPWILLLILAFAAAIVPVIEELFKTMPVWPLLRRRITDGEAFLGGLLGGAGFALFEAMFLPQPGEDWGVTMISRVGTTLIHAFTAGLAAWGLASAFTRRRPRDLVLSYLGAVGLHGAWNATVIAITANELSASQASVLGHSLPAVGMAILAALSLGALVGIVGMGRRLNRLPRPTPADRGPTPTAS